MGFYYGIVVVIIAIVILGLYLRYSPSASKDYFTCSSCGNKVHRNAKSCWKCKAVFSGTYDLQKGRGVTNVYEG